MNAVHFGAGNIGLGFIGLLLSRSGYRINFVDVNEERVALLNERGAYRVTLANGEADTTVVRNVSAISGKDAARVAEAVAEADLVTTAVGVTVLPLIAESIAQGIALRLRRTDKALTVIACENAINASAGLSKHVFACLAPEIREAARQLTAFPNAAVDRIVPLQQHEDKLQVTVEPFYEWVVERSGLPASYPRINGVHYVDELEPYVERKLFTVNTGHCVAAYYGFLSGYATIQESMRDREIVAKVRGVLRETGAVLIKRHGFDGQGHARYMDRILERFANPHLTDEVVRVGRSPIRKLSPGDRLVRPALFAYDGGIDAPNLTETIAAALLFDYAEDPESIQLQQALKEYGLHQTITRYTEIPEDHPLHASIVAAYRSLTSHT